MVKECWERTGAKPTSITWVDLNKGDDEVEDYRSRMCARDFNKGDERLLETFAGMPPLEALKLLLSL